MSYNYAYYCRPTLTPSSQTITKSYTVTNEETFAAKSSSELHSGMWEGTYDRFKCRRRSRMRILQIRRIHEFLRILKMLMNF